MPVSACWWGPAGGRLQTTAVVSDEGSKCLDYNPKVSLCGNFNIPYFQPLQEILLYLSHAGLNLHLLKKKQLVRPNNGAILLYDRTKVCLIDRLINKVGPNSANCVADWYVKMSGYLECRLVELHSPTVKCKV